MLEQLPELRHSLRTHLSRLLMKRIERQEYTNRIETLVAQQLEMLSRTGRVELVPQFRRPAVVGTEVVHAHGDERFARPLLAQSGGPLRSHFDERRVRQRRQARAAVAVKSQPQSPVRRIALHRTSRTQAEGSSSFHPSLPETSTGIVGPSLRRPARLLAYLRCQGPCFRSAEVRRCARRTRPSSPIPGPRVMITCPSWIGHGRSCRTAG